MKTLFSCCVLSLVFVGQALATQGMHPAPSLATTTGGYAALILFVLAYVLVIFEEKTHLRKSKPVMLAAGIIWILLAGIKKMTIAALDGKTIRPFVKAVDDLDYGCINFIIGEA